jgi:hypothetical protein
VSELACPDCGLRFLDGAGLSGHRTLAHDESVQRLPESEERAGTATRIAIALSFLVMIGLGALIALGATGAFDKKTVAEQPGTELYRIVRELKAEGTIDDFRAVEPDSGWDVEYEVNGGDGTLRERNENTAPEAELEVPYDDDLRDALEEHLKLKGFVF